MAKQTAIPRYYSFVNDALSELLTLMDYDKYHLARLRLEQLAKQYTEAAAATKEEGH